MSRRRALGIVCTLATVLLIVVGAWHLHKSRTVQLFGELVTAVDTRDPVVALTFDDGPGSVYTDSVLDLLKAENARATFFVIGEALERRPETARRIVAEGHELGNHSYSHRRLVLVPQRTIRHEVERTDSLIRQLGASGPIYFRPPYGKRLIGLPWYLARTGRITVLWSLEPDTWHRAAPDMARHVMENIRPGAIILLHVELQSRSEERRALRMMIDGLQRRGYDFVTVSELLAS